MYVDASNSAPSVRIRRPVQALLQGEGSGQRFTDWNPTAADPVVCQLELDWAPAVAAPADFWVEFSEQHVLVYGAGRYAVFKLHTWERVFQDRGRIDTGSFARAHSSLESFVFAPQAGDLCTVVCKSASGQWSSDLKSYEEAKRLHPAARPQHPWSTSSSVSVQRLGYSNEDEMIYLEVRCTVGACSFGIPLFPAGDVLDPLDPDESPEESPEDLHLSWCGPGMITFRGPSEGNLGGLDVYCVKFN